jgi:hypothetical protein
VLLSVKRVAAEALELTIPEPGTLHYDWFFTEDETRCVVREIYADSDAMLAHLGNVGDLLGRLVELGGGLEPEGFGSPSAELADAIAPFNPTVVQPLPRQVARPSTVPSAHRQHNRLERAEVRSATRRRQARGLRLGALVTMSPTCPDRSDVVPGQVDGMRPAHGSHRCVWVC